MKKILSLIFSLGLFLGLINMAEASDYQWTNISSGLDGTQIISVLQGDDGSLYAGGESCVGTDCTAKVWILRSGSSTWEDLTKDLSGSHIYSLIQGSDGTIYAGGRGYIDSTTMAAKVWKYNNTSSTNTWTEMASPSGYQSGLVFTLLQAANGSLYAGGYSDCSEGLCYAKVWQYSSGAWTDIMGSLSSGYVSTLYQAFDHTIYAGGYDNINMKVWKLESGVWTEMTNNLEDDTAVTTLIQVTDGSIYTGGSTFNYYDGNYYAKVWQYSSANVWADATGNLIGKGVFSLLQASNGSIYAGGYDSQLGAKIWKSDSGTWTEIAGDLSGTAIRSLIQGEDGSLYAAGYYGSYAQVWRYTPRKVEKQQDNLINAKRITLIKALKGYSIAGQNLIFLFNKIPSGNKWMKWIEYSGHPIYWDQADRETLDYWWIMTNTFSDKKFNIQTKFSYTDEELGSLTEKNLKLKYFDVKSQTWKMIKQNEDWSKYKVKHNLKNNTFTVTFKKFPEKEFYFAIGL